MARRRAEREKKKAEEEEARRKREEEEEEAKKNAEQEENKGEKKPQDWPLPVLQLHVYCLEEFIVVALSYHVCVRVRHRVRD